MSWMHTLYETYEACAGREEFTRPDQPTDGREIPALLPVSHVSQQAHLCVTIDGEGNFTRAEVLPPKTQVVIPATEDSAGRSGQKPQPHPLCDKIRYCAGDYQKREKQSRKKTGKEASEKSEHEQYLELLGAWCASPHAHPLAQAVFAYVQKGTLLRDLVECGVGAELSGGKAKSPDMGEQFVVWRVLSQEEPASWKNTSLQQAWREHYADCLRKREPILCLVSGQIEVSGTKHPRNIRRPGDGAKLLSANDTSNFTFRGRFLEAAQASSVGYEVSQKAHLALSWLIRRQGYRNGEQAVVAWAISGAPIPNPCENPFDVSDEELLTSAPVDAAKSSTVEEHAPQDMGQAFALRLGKALKGYCANLKDTANIMIMAMEAPSKGRLAVTFYREQLPDDYLENLRRWQVDCVWSQLVWPKVEGKSSKSKPRLDWLPAPVPKTIARAAYGRRCDDRLLKATIERLLPCIVDGVPLPRDLVESCVRRACNRAALEPWEWNEVLAVACALYKGWSIRTRNKEYGMALDESITSRDYLYGRLLAVAEYIERTALKAAGESRSTNAERLMQRFADHPCDTWRQIELQLSPYEQRLQGSSRAGLLFRARKTLDAIMNQFQGDDFKAPGKLSGEFLLGYHCQLTSLYSKSGDDTPEENP